MDAHELQGLLQFLRDAERLKIVRRSGFTSAGHAESVAEHTWRVCLMALLVGPELPDIDVGRLIRICVVHDLGEAIGGDVPAPEQARREAEGEPADKAARERTDLARLISPLPERLRREITGLWEEYEAATSSEARLAKALDKLETILQHTQGRNPADFDYRFNLGYGRKHTEQPEMIAALRELLDRATEDRARLAARMNDNRETGPNP